MEIILIRNGDIITTEEGLILPLDDKNKPSGPTVKLTKLGLVGWQEHITLKYLAEGRNVITLKPKATPNFSGISKVNNVKIVYTVEEQAEINELQEKINKIKEAAARRAKLASMDPSTLTEDELEELIRICQARKAELKGN